MRRIVVCSESQRPSARVVVVARGFDGHLNCTAVRAVVCAFASRSMFRFSFVVGTRHRGGL